MVAKIKQKDELVVLKHSLVRETMSSCSSERRVTVSIRCEMPLRSSLNRIRC